MRNTKGRQVVEASSGWGIGVRNTKRPPLEISSSGRIRMRYLSECRSPPLPVAHILEHIQLNRTENKHIRRGSSPDTIS